ncbi:MAG: hypothetical protein J6S85_01680 [Methanobrevibacter sp.]|nr:hypothetical protein [Methanobrevibacter sp.]MBO7712245.1 hypothetical protein [Methanobrevibacter sp.]
MEEDKLQKILQTVTEIKVGMEYMNASLSLHSETIKRHEERIGNIEKQLAVNDVLTDVVSKQANKNLGWFEKIAIGAITLIVGYIAVRTGLK